MLDVITCTRPVTERNCQATHKLLRMLQVEPFIVKDTVALDFEKEVQIIENMRRADHHYQILIHDLSIFTIYNV